VAFPVGPHLENQKTTKSEMTQRKGVIMERINISYHGDPIDRENKGQIKAQLAYHMGDAPSDASMCCCLSNEPEGYACNLRVHSAKGHLALHRESKDLNHLMEIVYASLKDSFAKWHVDPNHFAKSHPLTQVPCKGASHKDLTCPMHSFSHTES
jgi:hypothetical protein